MSYDTIRYDTVPCDIVFCILNCIGAGGGPFFVVLKLKLGRSVVTFRVLRSRSCRETGLPLQAGKGLPMMPALAGGAKNGCPFSSEVVELVVFVWCRAACERAELSRVAVCVA